MTAEVRNTIVNLRPLTDVAQIRLHSTTLYNTIYRADDELLVNSHIYRMAAAEAPVMYLRRIVGEKAGYRRTCKFSIGWGRRPAAGGG